MAQGGTGMEQDGTGMEQGGGACSTPPPHRDQGSGGFAQVGVLFASLGHFLRSIGRLFHRTGFPRCAGAGPALRRPREPPVTLPLGVDAQVRHHQGRATPRLVHSSSSRMVLPGYGVGGSVDFCFGADGLNFSQAHLSRLDIQPWDAKDVRRPLNYCLLAFGSW